jgi:hypothetical protein|tara:strand:- start:88 stop:483 length:396 start_codon:yes stop_codon:yes gene_type:complete
MANYEIEGRDKPFNMAVATLERIHEILTMINRLRYSTNDGIQISRFLVSLYNEIHPFLKETEKRPERKKAAKLKEKVAEEVKAFMPMYGRNNQYTCPKLNEATLEFERFLRDMMYKHDLLMPRPNDPSFSI